MVTRTRIARRGRRPAPPLTAADVLRARGTTVPPGAERLPADRVITVEPGFWESIARSPHATPDDVTILLDGTRLDTPDKVRQFVADWHAGRLPPIEWPAEE